MEGILLQGSVLQGISIPRSRRCGEPITRHRGDGCSHSPGYFSLICAPGRITPALLCLVKITICRGSVRWPCSRFRLFFRIKLASCSDCSGFHLPVLAIACGPEDKAPAAKTCLTPIGSSGWLSGDCGLAGKRLLGSRDPKPSDRRRGPLPVVAQGSEAGDGSS